MYRLCIFLVDSLHVDSLKVVGNADVVFKCGFYVTMSEPLCRLFDGYSRFFATSGKGMAQAVHILCYAQTVAYLPILFDTCVFVDLAEAGRFVFAPVLIRPRFELLEDRNFTDVTSLCRRKIAEVVYGLVDENIIGFDVRGANRFRL